MTVFEYCRHEAKWRDLVIIRKGGWVTCSAYIDHEDLFGSSVVSVGEIPA